MSEGAVQHQAHADEEDVWLQPEHVGEPVPGGQQNGHLAGNATNLKVRRSHILFIRYNFF